MKFSFFTVVAAVAAFLELAPFAGAGTNGFIVPSFRGSANSEAGYWETFAVPVGAPGNTADKAGATTGAVLTQADTNAFPTGSGNIYNLSGVSVFTLVDATPFALGTVVLQTRTLGSELDSGSPMLHYTDGTGVQTAAPLSQVELNRGNQPGLGATVSSLWQWNLTGLGITSYTITFRAAAPSLSFDSLTLDTSDTFTPVFTQPFVVNDSTPVIERWMYANNGAPCDRPAGATFATLGDEAGVDTRHAQHLVGWDTAAAIPTNRGPARYLVSRCRVTLTINRGQLFAYDPTQDDFRTYFETNHPAFQPDGDTGRPIELFGAAFRNGYDAANFDPCAPFGSNATGERNGYAAGWSTNGALVDVSNNVGKTNQAFPRFEVAPFAIGRTATVMPGQLVPAGTKISFDLNLADPFVLAYVQSALDTGRLRLMVSSLHTSAGPFGAPNYPDFATQFNEILVEPTRLELEGVAISSNDVDADGLPDDWELFRLHTLAQNGSADPDADGASNLAEYRAGTDPASEASTLKILSITRTAGGGATLRFPHAAGHRYRVEFTENFSGWNLLTNAPLFELATGLGQITDEAPAARRFYRVRSE